MRDLLTKKYGRVPKCEIQRSKIRLDKILVILVVAINVGVFLYHGDPREAVQITKDKLTQKNPKVHQKKGVNPTAYVASEMNRNIEIGPTSFLSLALKDEQTPMGLFKENGFNLSHYYGGLRILSGLTDFEILQPGAVFELFISPLGKIQAIQMLCSKKEKCKAVLIAEKFWVGQRET